MENEMNCNGFYIKENLIENPIFKYMINNKKEEFKNIIEKIWNILCYSKYSYNISKSIFEYLFDLEKIDKYHYPIDAILKHTAYVLRFDALLKLINLFRDTDKDSITFLKLKNKIGMQYLMGYDKKNALESNERKKLLKNTENYIINIIEDIDFKSNIEKCWNDIRCKIIAHQDYQNFKPYEYINSDLFDEMYKKASNIIDYFYPQCTDQWPNELGSYGLDIANSDPSKIVKYFAYIDGRFNYIEDFPIMKEIIGDNITRYPSINKISDDNKIIYDKYRNIIKNVESQISKDYSSGFINHSMDYCI